MITDCHHKSTLSRRHFALGGIAFACTYPQLSFAQNNNAPATLHGQLDIETFKNKVAVRGAADQSIFTIGNDAFLADAAFEGTFETDENNVLSKLSVVSGQLLSVLQPLSTRDTKLLLPNATGSIRGTGFYVNVSESKTHDYLCCCYGKIAFPDAKDGSAQSLETTYHHAVTIDPSGQFGTPDYKVPFGHYDDELVMLETQVNRAPHWQLPDDKLHFLSPTPVPLS